MQDAPPARGWWCAWNRWRTRISRFARSDAATRRRAEGRPASGRKPVSPTSSLLDAPSAPLRNLSKACLSLKSQAACHLPNGLRSMRPGGRPSHFITDAAGQGRSSRGTHGSLRGLTPAPSPPGGNSSICSSHAETRACPAEDKDSRAPRGARESASGLVWGQQKVPVPRRWGCCSTWGVGRPKPRRWGERSPPRAPDCSATRRRLSQGPRQEVVPPTVCPLGPTQRVAVTCVPRC